MGPIRLLLILGIFCSVGCLVKGKLKAVQKCGLKGLVGGVVAQEERSGAGGEPEDWPGYPWIVTLQVNWHNKGFKDICGVSVINRYWFLTAAHCFDYSNQTSKYAIYVGERKLASRFTFHAKRYNVKKIIIHEGYNPHDLSNDIAILRTTQRLNINREVGWLNGICLPHKHEEPTGMAFVRGWEHTRNVGLGINLPHEVEVPVVSPETCATLYGKDRMPHSVICAGDINKGSCQGLVTVNHTRINAGECSDSGSPLMHRNSRGRYTLIGIVSYGIGCGGMLPGIYTKVSAYIDWMDSHVIQYRKNG